MVTHVGGAALSVKKVTGKPIKFAATGEKLSDIEVFHPDRMARRILGMGDMLSVIEKAEESFDLEQAEKLEKQLRKKELDLDDYLAQIRQVKKMGSFSSLLKLIPGMNQIKDLKIDDKEFVKIEAIICSMTKAEKRDTRLLNASRRMRIAKRKWYNSTRHKQIHNIIWNVTKNDEKDAIKQRWHEKAFKWNRWKCIKKL